MSNTYFPFAAAVPAGAVGTANIADAAVTLAKLADIASSTFIARSAAGTGVPSAITGVAATALLDAVTTSAKGLVPTAPNDTAKFLRGDATWAAAAPAFSGVAVYNTATQSINSATQTAVTWDTELLDTASYHSTVSNTSRLVAPTTGKYLITASVEFATSATGQRYLKIWKNGSTTDLAFDSQHGVLTYQTSLECTLVLALTAGDYVEAVVYQDSGGALNIVGAIYHPFQMVYLGA